MITNEKSIAEAAAAHRWLERLIRRLQLQDEEMTNVSRIIKQLAADKAGLQTQLASAQSSHGDAQKQVDDLTARLKEAQATLEAQKPLLMDAEDAALLKSFENVIVPPGTIKT